MALSISRVYSCYDFLVYSCFTTHLTYSWDQAFESGKTYIHQNPVKPILIREELLHPVLNSL